MLTELEVNNLLEHVWATFEDAEFVGRTIENALGTQLHPEMRYGVESSGYILSAHPLDWQGMKWQDEQGNWH